MLASFDGCIGAGREHSATLVERDERRADYERPDSKSWTTQEARRSRCRRRVGHTPNIPRPEKKNCDVEASQLPAVKCCRRGRFVYSGKTGGPLWKTRIQGHNTFYTALLKRPPHRLSCTHTHTTHIISCHTQTLTRREFIVLTLGSSMQRRQSVARQRVVPVATTWHAQRRPASRCAARSVRACAPLRECLRVLSAQSTRASRCTSPPEQAVPRESRVHR